MNTTKLYIVSFCTIVRKEIIRILRIWKQTLLPPIITQTLYFLIFGTFIGSQIGGFEEIGGYMAFIIPGLVMMSIITNSFQNVVSTFYGAKFQRNIEELLVSPTPMWIILGAYVCSGILRGIVVGGIVLSVSLFFVRLHIDHVFIVIIFALLTSNLFSHLGFLASLFAKSFDDISIIPTFILTPLIYLGGVFYSVDRLSPLWQKISQFNPIVYMIDGFRYGFHSFGTYSVWTSMLALLFCNLLFTGLNYYLLNKGAGLKT